MTRLVAWLRLPPPQRALALEAAACLTLARLLVYHVPMRYWRRRVETVDGVGAAGGGASDAHAGATDAHAGAAATQAGTAAQDGVAAAQAGAVAVRDEAAAQDGAAAAEDEAAAVRDGAAAGHVGTAAGHVGTAAQDGVAAAHVGAAAQAGTAAQDGAAAAHVGAGGTTSPRGAGEAFARGAAGPRPQGRAVARMVRRVARRLPFEALCLPQAMATQWMLRRRGVAARLWIGVRRAAPEQPPDYHAWLTVDGESVIGGRTARDYVPFPWPPGPTGPRPHPRRPATGSTAP